MKTILVTGGAGFLGSHTCLSLLEKGYEVSVIDTFVNSSKKSLDRAFQIYRSNKNNHSKNKLKVFNGDLCDINFLNKVFSNISKNKTVLGVVHLAGLKAVSESIVEPLKYWKSNVISSLNLLEVMKKFNCHNLVFSSSATIYAEANNSLLKESSLINPINPYGNTKVAIEKLLEDIFDSPKNKFKFASLRYFNPIGAHPSGLMGEDPKGIPNNIFPLISNTAMGFQKTLKIFGNDWPTEDGTPIRDFIHVMDLAEAHVEVMELLIKNENLNLKLNIGTGCGTSILDLVKIFEKVNNVKVPFIFTKRREGDVSHVVADNSLSISKYNISCKRNLQDMCRDEWKWKKQNPNGYS